MDIDCKDINVRTVKCPACGSEFDYREFIESETIIVKRYKALIAHLKEEWGEIKINDNDVLLGKIKELEHLYSILIK